MSEALRRKLEAIPPRIDYAWTLEVDTDELTIAAAAPSIDTSFTSSSYLSLTIDASERRSVHHERQQFRSLLEPRVLAEGG